METLGVILMVVGFIVGVYGGLTLSRREVMVHSNGELNKGKQMVLSAISGASALAMIAGFLFYFQVF